MTWPIQGLRVMREAVRMMVDKNLATPPETFTEAEKVLHRDRESCGYFDELRTKVKASRHFLQEQREQKLPAKEARKVALRNPEPALDPRCRYGKICGQ